MVAQEDVNAVLVLDHAFALAGLQQGVGSVLHQLENLSIAVATGKHGFLNAEVLFEQSRVRVVRAPTTGIELLRNSSIQSQYRVKPESMIESDEWE